MQKARGRLFTLSLPSITGLVLILSGLAILFVAAAALRGSYSSTLVVRQDHQLVTHGVYRWVRHPIYLGVSMVCFGVALYASSLLGLLIMCLLIPVIFSRARMEEIMLIEEQGEAYRAPRRPHAS